MFVTGFRSSTNAIGLKLYDEGPTRNFLHTFFCETHTFFVTEVKIILFRIKYPKHINIAINLSKLIGSGSSVFG